MNKILLNIYIPAIGEMIEIRVSKSLKIAQLTEMIKEYIFKDTTIDYIPTKSTRLCDSKKGSVYLYNSFLSELELSEGQTLVLI